MKYLYKYIIAWHTARLPTKCFPLPHAPQQTEPSVRPSSVGYRFNKRLDIETLRDWRAKRSHIAAVEAKLNATAVADVVVSKRQSTMPMGKWEKDK